MAKRSLVLRAIQRYWRLTRGLTLGAQGVIIDARGRVLLVRHGYRPGWHFPGGGVEKSESLETALTREMQEEAGVEIVEPPELFGIYTNFEMFPNDHIALFVVRHWRQPGVPKPNAEIAEQGFFAQADLPEGTSRATSDRLCEILNGAPRSAKW